MGDWMRALLAQPPSHADTAAPAGPAVARPAFAHHLARPLFCGAGGATLVDLAEGFPSALPPGFMRSLLAAVDALAAEPPLPPPLPPGARVPCLEALRLRAGLALLHAHLAPAFAAQAARVGALLAGPTPPASAAATLLSAACGALLPCFTMAEAMRLRGVNKEFAAACASHAWADAGTRVRSAGALRALLRALPRARALNLSRLADATDAALAPLLAAHAPAALDLSSRTALTGACLDSEALARACTRLSLAACRALRGSALAALARHPLARLHTLDVSDCPQLRDEHLAPLGRGLAVLRAARCDGLSGAFAAGFAGGRLGELNLSGNCNAALGGSARAFAALAGTLTVLSVAACAALTDAHVAALTRLRVLDVSACSGLTSAAFAGLGALQVLYMGGCRQAGMDAGALEHLGAAQGLVVVEMTDCAPTLVRAARARGLPVRV